MKVLSLAEDESIAREADELCCLAESRKTCLEALKSGFPYVFAKKKYPGSPQVIMHQLSTETFQIGHMEIIPIRMMHYRLPVLGFRIGKFAYLTDGNYISESEKKKLIGVKYLVVNALRREKHISHFTLSEAVSLIVEIGAVTGYLTHISHQMGPCQKLKKELPENVQPAYDGLVLEV